jgi:hypothetical protein
VEGYARRSKPSNTGIGSQNVVEVGTQVDNQLRDRIRGNGAPFPGNRVVISLWRTRPWPG